MQNLRHETYINWFCGRTKSRMKIPRPPGDRLGLGDIPNIFPTYARTLALACSAVRSACVFFAGFLSAEGKLALDSARQKNILPGYFSKFEKARFELSFAVPLMLISPVVPSEVILKG